MFRISPRQSFQRSHKYLLSLLQTLETVLLPPSAGFPHAYLSLSCNSAWNLVCATSTTTLKAGFIFLILQMRTAEAHRDRRQLAQDSTLAKGLDSRFVASRVHRSLHHTASSPGGGLVGVTSVIWLPHCLRCIWVELQNVCRYVVLFWGVGEVGC